MTLIYLKINYIIFILYSKDLQDLSSLFTLHALFHLFTLYFYFFLPHLFSSHPLLQIFSLPQWVQTTNTPNHSTHIFLFKSWSSFRGNYLFLFFFPPSAPPFFSWSTIIKKYSFGGDTFMVTPLEKAV